MIDNFFKNKYAQALLVFLAVLGVAYMYQSLSRPYGPGMMSSNMLEMHDEVNSEGREGALGHEMEEIMEEAGAPQEMLEMHEDMEDLMEEVDYSGTHIMPNGDVMLRGGEVVEEAIINADGTVTMPDGTVLDSVMDMR